MPPPPALPRRPQIRRPPPVAQESFIQKYTAYFMQWNYLIPALIFSLGVFFHQSYLQNLKLQKYQVIESFEKKNALDS